MNTFTQPDKYKKLLLDPTNKIYYNPQTTNGSIIEYLRANDVNDTSILNQIDDVSTTYNFLEQNLSHTYEHHISGKLYDENELNLDDIDLVHLINKSKNEKEALPYEPVLLKTDDNGLKINLAYFNRIIENIHDNDPSNMYNSVLQHQYANQYDHLVSYELYYNNDNSQNTIIIETPNYQGKRGLSLQSRSDIATHYHNLGLSKADIETFSHPLIDKVNTLMDSYFKWDITGVQEFNQEGHVVDSDKIFTMITNTYTTLLPTYINLWIYQNIKGKWTLTPNTWLSNHMGTDFLQLSEYQQQAILNYMYGFWLDSDNRTSISSMTNNSYTITKTDHDIKLHGDILNDHLIAYDSKVPNQIDNPLPILNDNSFVSQLSAMADSNLYYDENNVEATYVKAKNVENYELPLSNQVFRHALTNQSMYNNDSDNPYLKDMVLDGQPIYYADGTLYRINYQYVNIIIFAPIKNNTEAHVQSLVNTEKKSMVLTHFKYKSGYEYYIGTEMTNHNDKNYVILPIRSLYDTDSPDLKLPNNQLNLKTISPLKWDYHKDIEINSKCYGIMFDWVTNAYDGFYIIRFDKIHNAAEPNDEKHNQKVRKAALTNDKTFQNYILSL